MRALVEVLVHAFGAIILGGVAALVGTILLAFFGYNTEDSLLLTGFLWGYSGLFLGNWMIDQLPPEDKP